MLCNMFAVTSFAEDSDKPTSYGNNCNKSTMATESDSTTYDLRFTVGPAAYRFEESISSIV